MDQTAIEISNLKKTFDGQHYVFQGVDLKIPKGKITCLIGFSGTGKSVLLKHILGLLMPSEGKIIVLGQDLTLLHAHDKIQFRKHFGVLFQNAALFDDMTVIENVMFPLREHRAYLSEREKTEIATARLKLVKLDEIHYHKLPNELSGGMRKRVGLARAIALDPDILVYDEPTTGLDPILTETVDDLILETHRHRAGLTSLVVSHDLYAAFRIGDYIAMLDSGRILLFGTPQDFYNSEIPLVKKFVSKGMKKS
ncbi:MAG: ABC transporter ATP-binding protein [Proteobacteria bacterium SG_bin7]|nr:MAG: ABC transporter ATP-binding protein [Proteobacteria bacterium SG_bin7]